MVVTPMPQHFIPRNESFTCGHCGKSVARAGRGTGTSYRNHCPHCLWSLHVDYQLPGDRQSRCRGPMEPSGITIRRSGEYVLTHKCTKCGKLSLNRIAGDDDFDLILNLS